MISKEEELSIAKTIKQANGEEPLGMDIRTMTLEQLNKLEQDLNDTEAFINMNGGHNELSKNIVNSLRAKIEMRKREINGKKF